MIHKELEQELREWLRPVSPLVTFAKSLRMEEGATKEGASTKEGQQQVAEKSPFDDIDWDELPTDQKTKLEAAKTAYEAKTKEAKDATGKISAAEKFAREQQSRADRASGVLRHHNISLDAAPGAKTGGSGDTKEEILFEQFKKDGLAEPQARAYAKMFQTAGKVERDELLQQLAPLIGSVGNLQADGHLNNARREFSQVFAVPELDKQISDNVRLLVQNGQHVLPDTVQHLAQMAWGQYTLKNPDALKTVKQDATIPTMKSGMRTGGSHTPTPREDGKAPVATQADTVNVMNEVTKQMRVGMPTKKK